MRVGNRLGDVSHAVQTHVEEHGFSVVRSLVGHGIGRSMHEEPQIPNYGPPGKGVVLEEGMVLAIEPMVTAGRHMVRMGDDGWAIYSQDGSLAAHFEFTVAITADGPRILTPWHESPVRAVAWRPAHADRSPPRGASAASRPRGRGSIARTARTCGDRGLAPVALPAPVALAPRCSGRAAAAQPSGSDQRSWGWNAGPRGASISPGTQPARDAPQRPG